MFDIGWTEILILATVSLFVIGPKEIPKFLGYIGKMVANKRNKQRTTRFVDDAIKNSELEDIRKEISFSDPELSKNFNEIVNPSSVNKKTEHKDNLDKKNEDKEDNSSNVKNINKEEADNGKTRNS